MAKVEVTGKVKPRIIKFSGKPAPAEGAQTAKDDQQTAEAAGVEEGGAQPNAILMKNRSDAAAAGYTQNQGWQPPPVVAYNPATASFALPDAFDFKWDALSNFPGANNAASAAPDQGMGKSDSNF